ncbi:MAG: SOS response-associated peptidase family protein, partial [Leeuwenhoekiella sp.]
MCYKSSLIVDIEFLEDRYQVKRSPKLKEKPSAYQSYHFNGFAHPNMLIIPQQKTDVITDAFWGLMDPRKNIEDKDAYYKDAARYGGGLNARSEEVFNHFIYKYSIYEKRCLVPLSGFYEPHRGSDGKSYPFYFEHKKDMVLSVAGLYSITADGGVTYALLTKPA